MIHKSKILGIPVTHSSYKDIEEYLLESGPKSRTVIDIVTMSFPMIGVYEKNLSYRKAINESSVTLPDGIMMVWLSRLSKARIKERISGPDFFRQFSKRANLEKIGYFFLGSTPEVLDKIQNRLAQEFPDIKWCGGYSPPFNSWPEKEEEKIIKIVNSSKSDILWVGLTAPKQEIWVCRNKARLHTRLVASIGATFDFYAGTRKRAPQLMQRLGFEWLFRILQEPFRMGPRYLSAIPGFLRRWFNNKRN